MIKIFIGVILVLFLTSCSNEKPKPFLHGINLDKGNHALLIIIGNKKYWIEDPSILKKYRNNLYIKVSLANWLPGKANRNQGMYLYTNGKLIRSVTGAIFNHFEYSEILSFASAFDEVMEKVYITGTKKELLALNLEKLKTDPLIYGLELPKFDDKERPWHIKVKYPSLYILDDKFDNNELKKQFYEKLEKDIKKSNCTFTEQSGWTDFNNSQATLFDKNFRSLKNKDGKDISIPPLKVIFNYEFTIKCKDITTNWKNYDFSPYKNFPIFESSKKELKTIVDNILLENDIKVDTVYFSAAIQDNFEVKNFYKEEIYELRYMKKKR